MAWTDNRALMGPTGLSSLFIKAIGDDAYYDISQWMRNTSLVYESIGVTDKKKREHGIAFMVTLTGTVMSVDVTNLLLILDSMITKNILVKAQGNNGNTFTSAAVSATTGYMGVQAHLEIGGNFTEERFLTFTLVHVLAETEGMLIRMGDPPRALVALIPNCHWLALKATFV